MSRQPDSPSPRIELQRCTATIQISPIKCESRMGETRHATLVACRVPDSAAGSVSYGVADLSGRAREVAQHEGQDAAVAVVAELLLGIDPAQHLDGTRLAVGGGDRDRELL